MLILLVTWGTGVLGLTQELFSASAKIWANKWYESYHVTVDPTGATYDGTLVVINAVKDGIDVVLKNFQICIDRFACHVQSQSWSKR